MNNEKREWFLTTPAMIGQKENGQLVTIPASRQRWVEINNKCATDCIFEGKGYTAEEFLSRITS